MNRTLVLQSRPWSYSDKGWTSVFLPLSGGANGQNDDYAAENSCVNSEDEVQEWSSGVNYQESKIISLPIVDSLHPRPPQLPLAFPKELASELL
uniref:GT23 domain-containing protein n=1 Tax=Romanomermis culicivorax TaxID=13658 RepID=A0A915HX40_ROMCU